jgi:TonB family protein
MSSRWGWAVGGSLVIHGLLFGFAWRARPRAAIEVAPVRAPLAVQLWEPSPPATSPGTTAAEGRARSRRGGSREEHPAIAAEPTALSVETPGPSTEPVPRGAEGLGPNGGVEGGNEAGSSVAASGPSVPDLTALHQRLAEAAQSCYPAAARRLRLSGQLELAFCASADGRASNPSLGSSSGSELLDRAALDCLLARATPLPVRSGCFRVPVRFGMP